MKVHFVASFILPLVIGAALFFAHPPFSYWGVGVSVLAATLWLTRLLPAKAQSIIVAGGWSIYILAIYLWLPLSLEGSNALPVWLAWLPFFLIGVVAFTACLFVMRVCQSFAGLGVSVMLTFLTLEAVLAMTFPYGLMGYNLGELPGAYRFARTGGVLLLSAVWLFIAVSPLLNAPKNFLARAVLVLSTVGALYYPAPEPTGPPLASHVFSIENTESIILPTYDETAAWAKAYSKQLQHGSGTAIGPETPMGFMDSYQDGLFRGAAANRGNVLLLGAVTSNGGFFQNSTVVMTDQGISQSYHKRLLVPFAEVLPFREWVMRFSPVRNLVNKLENHHGNFKAGGADQKAIQIYGATLDMRICWEAAFPYLGMPSSTNLIVNQSNDAWFELNQAKRVATYSAMRAMENGTYVVRVAAAGFSGFISPTGQWIRKQELAVPLLTVNTPFSNWGRLTWFLFLLVIPIVWLGRMGRRVLARRPVFPVKVTGS